MQPPSNFYFNAYTCLQKLLDKAQCSCTLGTRLFLSPNTLQELSGFSPGGQTSAPAASGR